MINFKSNSVDGSVPLLNTLTKQVFSFSGNVDHLLNIEFSCVINGDSSYNGSGWESTHINGASSRGIYYNCTYEGWHGDLQSTIYITPLNITNFSSNSSNTFYFSLRNGRNQSSGFSILQYPSASNNYIAKIQIYDPGGGEGYYNFALTMSVTTSGKVFFNGERMERVFFNGSQVY